MTDWCILRTSGARTLKLADSLAAAGFDVWTPTRITKREAPGNRRRLVMGQRKVMFEVARPILPRFVFASADRLDDLTVESVIPDSKHPAFQVVRSGDRVPLVTERQMVGLRAAEAEAAAALAVERDAEARLEQRRLRAERLGTERARRKALRLERKALQKGAEVTIDDAPSLAGVVGVVVEGRGTSAVIHFGGALTMEVEAWRVHPVGVRAGDTRDRAAA